MFNRARKISRAKLDKIFFDVHKKRIAFECLNVAWAVGFRV